MTNKKTYILVIAFLLSLVGCSQKEFNLPPGDAEAGRATFVLLQCNDCHSVEGVEYVGGGDIDVRLGGKTTKVKSYADLVTSVINPSHKLSRGQDPSTVSSEGESTMRDYNEVMTVQELVNLVTFLQSKYEIWVPEHYTYPAH